MLTSRMAYKYMSSLHHSHSNYSMNLVTSPLPRWIPATFNLSRGPKTFVKGPFMEKTLRHQCRTVSVIMLPHTTDSCRRLACKIPATCMRFIALTACLHLVFTTYITAARKSTYNSADNHSPKWLEGCPVKPQWIMVQRPMWKFV